MLRQFPTKCQVEHIILFPLFRNKIKMKKTKETKNTFPVPIFPNEKPYYEESYYINNILNFNLKLQKTREETAKVESMILKKRVKLNSNTDRMDCLQVPVMLQMNNGNKLLFSNNKIEPKEMKIINFVKMNLKHQNINSYEGKGICNAFSNRRRRRRTHKNK